MANPWHRVPLLDPAGVPFAGSLNSLSRFQERTGFDSEFKEPANGRMADSLHE